jgi:sucrose phosphorylase
VGLLAGANDLEAVARTGEGRAINRHDDTAAEIEAALERPVVKRILELVRLRKDHPAFDAELEVTLQDTSRLRMTWSHGHETVELMADIASGEMTVRT